MQGPALAQRQQLRMIPVQIQANAILGMSLVELHQFIETEAVENPALNVAEGARCPVCGLLCAEAACPVCGAAMKAKPDAETQALDERDYLDRAFSAAAPTPAFDPFRTVASEVSLKDHLKQQARLTLAGRHLRIADYLIDALDDDGYFRESLFETAEAFAAAVPEVESVLSIIHTFDPVGVGARDLRQCLLIQLRHLDSPLPVAASAERMLAECWSEFSKLRHRAIAKRLGVTQTAVREACEFIKSNLNPRPASAYQAPFDSATPAQAALKAPDVVIRRRGDEFLPEVVDGHLSLLGVDETYEDIYQSIRAGEAQLGDGDCSHIKEYVERARSVLEAIGLRKKTLIRVANWIADYQSDYLAQGPARLKPLRQKDVAQALGVHESTVCRALAGKFCRLPSGEVVSFEVFFDAALPIRNLIAQLIAASAKPLSDGQIAAKLAEQGFEVARRTVAKYRDQLRLPPCHLRAASR